MCDVNSSINLYFYEWLTLIIFFWVSWDLRRCINWSIQLHIFISFIFYYYFPLNIFTGQYFSCKSKIWYFYCRVKCNLKPITKFTTSLTCQPSTVNTCLKTKKSRISSFFKLSSFNLTIKVNAKQYICISKRFWINL